MKKFLQKRKRKGFTLVELLIVIIIIGILAGSMMLVMGAGRDKAEATKIVSNLRTLKAATLMCFADNNAWPPNDGIASLEPYMDATMDGYDIEVTSPDGAIFVHYTLDPDAGVEEKLIAMAVETRLLDAADVSGDYNGGTGPWMLVND